MLIGNHLLGWSALFLTVLALSYCLLKRTKVKRKTILNGHCYLAIIATVLAFVHVGMRLSSFTFSVSYICLISMLLSTITGIILKYFKIKNKLFFKRVHVALTMVFVLTLIIHIITAILRILIG